MLVQWLRFGDDIATVADSEENPETMLQKMNSTLKQEYNLNINKTKTSILIGKGTYRELKDVGLGRDEWRHHSTDLRIEKKYVLVRLE
ncbi:Hypothetical protein CINCED_3A015971 [Cinara cedri]|uniref:Reverse transcriptase domain n=1 Tax=Cinara cedri TaxID=506608 RepID=A0A5E4M712_9HEMI|nr:Hypothetical protein CINCED_3A015971 [Cinara cedri]